MVSPDKKELTYSFSTIWNAWRQVSAAALVDEVLRLGFNQVELSASLSPLIYGGMKKEVEKGAIKVSSLHNVCPAPCQRVKRLNLCDPNEKARQWAVKNTISTIEAAGNIGASSVVVHLGFLPPRRSWYRIYRWAQQGQTDQKNYRRLFSRILLHRDKKSPKLLEQGLKSLEELIPAARSAGIRIGIENRYYPWEIPNIDEIGQILSQIPTPELGYWHDLGHAQVRENLGENCALDYLERYEDRLVGLHIHDVAITRDHQAPGKGQINYVYYKRWLKIPGVIKVLEIHPPANTEEIQKAKTLLGRI